MIGLNSTLQTVALGTAALGALAGSLGTFAVLRRQSLLADAVSHAALPGVVLLFLLTRVQNPVLLSAGGGLAGWLGALAVLGIVRVSRVPFDAALALVLSVFFGVGALFLGFTKNIPGRTKQVIQHILVGQSATMSTGDVLSFLACGAVVAILLIAFWKEVTLLSFDPGFTTALGRPAAVIDAGLMLLLVVAVVMGLQAVGVVLMSALVVAPAVAVRPWCNRIGPLVILSGVVGGLCGFGGTIVADGLAWPTGPVVVLIATAVVAVSLVADRWREGRHGPG